MEQRCSSVGIGVALQEDALFSSGLSTSQLSRKSSSCYWSAMLYGAYNVYGVLCRHTECSMVLTNVYGVLSIAYSAHHTPRKCSIRYKQSGVLPLLGSFVCKRGGLLHVTPETALLLHVTPETARLLHVRPETARHASVCCTSCHAETARLLHVWPDSTSRQRLLHVRVRLDVRLQDATSETVLISVT